MVPVDGEKLHEARRKRFWVILGGLGVLGAITGAVGQFAIEAGGAGSFPAWAITAGGIGVIIVAILVAYGSWRFFASVDELELADNLWGSLVGFYWYAILFPAWWALNKLGWAPALDHWGIFVSSMIAAALVYFYRKWRVR